MLVTGDMTTDHGYMELQQLRYVIEVAATSSFTRAAERCFVTQSALSHQVAALERELGERLFVRSSRSVRVTEAGEAFLEHARTAVAAAENARDAASSAGGRVVGTLRLGIIPTVTALDVPALIARFRSAHPDARVELTVGNSDALVDALRRGELDAALLGLRPGVEPRGVAVRELSRERLVAAVPRAHRLAGRRRVRLADLADETFADFPSGTSGRAQSDAAFAAAGIARDVAFEADSAALMLGLVSAGVAVTLLAPGAVASAASGVVAVAVSDGPERIEYAAWDARSPRGVTSALLRAIEALAPIGRDTATPDDAATPDDGATPDDEAGPEESSEPAPSRH
ncbi:HTH-type transcriptional regulator GltC [Microbacterium foliorum]|nr:HTH-type transcriptional regulator GltC [Microbacterium foliorum]CAH0198008.1 HTH-type transcriptional regulator GltC [Microbacterium foliorum]